MGVGKLGGMMSLFLLMKFIFVFFVAFRLWQGSHSVPARVVLLSLLLCVLF